MNKTFIYFVLCSVISWCNGVSFQEQLEHVIQRRRESLGIHDAFLPTRRQSILGTPNMASHLPEAEAILPGHTLLRPSLGMLKSAVKFPHKDPDNGGWVYGNIDNLGITYDGKNKRVLYSGFRRGLSDYIMVIPVKSNEYSKNHRFAVSSVVLDLNKNRNENNAFVRQHKLNSKNKKRHTLKSKKKHIKKILEILPAKLKHHVVDEGSDDGSQHKKSVLYNSHTLSNSLSSGKVKKKSLRQLEEVPPPRLSIEKESNNDGNNTSSIETEKEKRSKTEWFWNTKDAYTHIKLSEAAPNQVDLLPSNALTDEIRNWWFYHQDDYKPFVEP